MSRVAVVVDDLPLEKKAAIIARIRATTGDGYDTIAGRLQNGQPILDCVLFRNDHDELSRRLRKLLTELPSMGVRLRVLESAEQEPAPSGSEITVNTLLNILKAHDQEKERQQQMWDEHGHI